jgi:hypothetical protein
VAGDAISLSSIKNGRYKLRLYHTWRGEFLQEKEIEVSEERLTINLPYLHTTGSHANYAGPDMAFILEVIPENIKEVKPKRKNSKTR